MGVLEPPFHPLYSKPKWVYCSPTRVGGELGDVNGGGFDGHGGLETFKALIDVSQVGGADL
ncbi:hypothetical protein TIFTF001_008764 [Ficus carica]|uniref:Uncharacterized protein n=1 Tax=Ficus carica TaxID=3494 RepID=A0AA88D0V6_FICCA|nr:hypothetical protein TIFTF001_008764 [Ficus carica]